MLDPVLLQVARLYRDTISQAVIRSTTKRGAARIVSKSLKIDYKDAKDILSLSFWAVWKEKAS
jgi:hypothetical protein